MIKGPLVALKFGRSIRQDQVRGFVKDQVLEVRGGIFEAVYIDSETFTYASNPNTPEDVRLSFWSDLSLEDYNRATIHQSCES